MKKLEREETKRREEEEEVKRKQEEKRIVNYFRGRSYRQDKKIKEMTGVAPLEGGGVY